MPVSLFDFANLPTDVLAWYHNGPRLNEFDDRTELVRSDLATYRASQQIDPAYIVNGAEAYVARILFLGPASRLTLNLASTASDGNFGVREGPELTDAAEMNLGIAVRLTNGTVYKYAFANLIARDPTEPYDWDNVEDEATWDAIVAAIRADSGFIRSLLVDTTNPNVDFDRLIFTPDPAPAQASAELRAALTVTARAALSDLPEQDAEGTAALRVELSAAARATLSALPALAAEGAPALGVRLSANAPATLSIIAPADAQAAPALAVNLASTAPATLALRLADFTAPAGHVLVASALIEADPDSSDFLYRDEGDASDTGTLLEGSLQPEPGYTMSRIRRYTDTGRFQLNDNPDSDDLAAFFAAGGAGNQLTIHLQDAQGAASFDAATATVNNSSGDFVRWDVPAAFQTVMNRIRAGSRFILAFTRLPTRQDAEGAPALAINLSADAPATASSVAAARAQASAILGTALAAIARATLSVPNVQLASAAPDLAADLSATARAALSVPGAQPASAAPDLAARLSAAARAALIDPGAQAAEGAPALRVGLSAAARAALTVAPVQAAEGTPALRVRLSAAARASAALPTTVDAVVLPARSGAEVLPALAASVDGQTRWPGGLLAEVESYRSSMYGGPDACTLNAAGPEPGLHWLLTQLRRPVHVHSRQAGLVWWGYVHRVELRLGAIAVTVTLDGFRTAVAVQYLRDGQELGLRTAFHVEQPQAGQYGRIELLGAREEQEPTAGQLATMLDPYLQIGRAMEVSRQAATGARIYCRGWSAALEWRYVPRYHPNTRYADIASRRDGRGQYGGLPSTLSITSATEVEWAAWLDFSANNSAGHPGYDVYLSSARLFPSGPGRNPQAGYSDDWHASIWKRARATTGDPTATDPPGERIGDEVDLDASGLPRVPSPIPSPPPHPRDITQLTELDFSGQDILLPQAGFFVVIRGTLTADFRWGNFDAASARWTWARTGGSGSWTAAAGSFRPSFDFFARLRGQALLRLLLDGHDLLSAGPAPDNVGGHTRAVYLEGVETIAHVLQQVQDEDQLAYAIDPARGVHFFAGGQRRYELARNGTWRTPVARGSMAFLGQWVCVPGAGQESICEHAVFTPRTGLWDLSFRALPTASELAAQRQRSQRIARQGP